MIKKIATLILLNFILLSIINAQDQYLIKDKSLRLLLTSSINNFVEKEIGDSTLFERDDNPEIYDISNNGDMSYIAVVGCFRFKMSCKFGFDLLVFKWDKEKNKLYSISVPKNYSVAYLTGIGKKGKKFRELFFIQSFYMSLCNEAIEVQVKYSRNKIILQPIHLAGHNVPYNIMKIIRDNQVLNNGNSMCELEKVISVIRYETIRKKKYYYIKCFQDLKFQCDLEGINCKLIEQK